MHNAGGFKSVTGCQRSLGRSAAGRLRVGASSGPVAKSVVLAAIESLGKIYRWRGLGAPILVAFACILAGCAATPVTPYSGTAPRHQTLYVLDNGWHTEIGVPVDTLSTSLAALVNAKPDIRYVVFGWGQRNYYMAGHPGLDDLIGAAFPSRSVVLVIPLAKPPTKSFTSGVESFALPVSRDGLDRLSEFIADSIARNSRHRPNRLGEGPDPGSSFYASTETYSLAQTCNTWTAEALRVAGLPVSASGVIFAHQVIDQVRGLAMLSR